MRTITASVVGLLILSVVTYRLQQKPAIADEKSLEPLAVQTVRVKTETIVQQYDTVGVLKPLRKLVLKPGINGRVEKIWFRAGAQVKQGDTLLSLQPQTVLKAPFSGFLGDWQIEIGDLVDAQQSLVEIIDRQSLVIDYTVPEQYAADLKLNQSVSIRTRAFPEQDFKGKVVYIAPLVDPSTYTISVRAQVENTDKLLLPGMSSHITQDLSSVNNALLVPAGSVMTRLDGYKVFRVNGNKAELIPVTLGARFQARQQILTGLEANEQVVLVINYGLKDGDQVISNEWDGTW